METCILLSARSYNFRDDSGRQVEGVTLNYLTGDVEKEADRRGCMPMSITAPSEVWPNLGPLPGYYGVDFKQRPGKGGKPTLQVVSVKFLGALELNGPPLPPPTPKQ